MDTNYTKIFQAFRGISDYLISPCRGGLPLLLDTINNNNTTWTYSDYTVISGISHLKILI